MALIKKLVIECSKCGYYDESFDCDNDFDEKLEMENCPNCLKECAEKI